MTEHKLTQCEKILNHLQRDKYISAFEAYSLYGITQLSARLCDLKKKGFAFGSERVNKKAADGTPISYMKYYLA